MIRMNSEARVTVTLDQSRCREFSQEKKPKMKQSEAGKKKKKDCVEYGREKSYSLYTHLPHC